MNSRRPSSAPHGRPKRPRGNPASAAERRAASKRRSQAEAAEREQAAKRKRDRLKKAAEEEIRARAFKPRAAKPGASQRGGRERRRETTPTGPQFNSKRYFVYQGASRTRRFSVRAFMVLLFLAIGALIVASPLASYLNQQEQKRAASAELAQATQRADELERELARWQDPKFVQTQARERLGYVMPGETLYVVPREGTESAEDRLKKQVAQVNKERRAATPFFITLRDSINIAGKASTKPVENPSEVPILNAPKPAPSATPSQAPSAPASGAPTGK
ncbi:cell division protein FtsB [Arcanobacterium wilhelmae]|uniref:Cell division protein FtsB n=1 Tax=Arcanobacterium wilhelmae TaxID=1803177 RepID=A0ABT9NCY7_9ACTO|nr:septum formation initiator family protein [Arcanobacterium wilhelmae]MDP9801241.1 cell division protein FtsB [Arcanobacterium wilhelmae]WFN90590.1 septum formation initiator family protein [Arcanobacterium wilhelmae]